MNVETYVADYEPIQLPVYGMKTDDSAVLAIIEKGAALAVINSDISGRSDEFNRVYPSFVLRDIELLSVLGTASGGSPRYPDDVYRGDIVVRFKFIYGEEANYTGMAHVYRDYLLDNGMLVVKELPQDAPFFAEIVGSVRQTKFFAGIPYESTAVATTLVQSEEILEAICEAGVKRPILLLKGFYEGGVKHESLSVMNLESSTGSKKALNRLADKAEKLGGETYLVTNAEKVYTTDHFSKSSQASRRQDDFVASVVDYAEPILARERGYEDSFYVSPAYLKEYCLKLAGNVKKAGYAVSGIALDDLGGLLVGDYRNRKYISRISAVDTVKEAISILAGDSELTMKAPNDYVLFAAGAIYDLPSGNNGHKVEDEAVPFIQLVLDGTGVYCSKAWNESAYNGVWRAMNYAIESKSAPHFIFTCADETVFLHTEDMDSQRLFMTQYKQWLDDVSEIYAAYNAYWQLVKDARISGHEVLADDLRRVSFDNGVIAYVNYSSKDIEADGVRVPAQGYVVLEEGK